MGRARAALVVLSVVLVGTAGCGKERVSTKPEVLPAPWDPPTAAHGFRRVPMTDCTPYVPASIPLPETAPEVATGETAETIARLSRRPTSLAANATYVFWAEVDDEGTGGVFRATRPIARDRWVVEPLAEEQARPGEVAADRYDVYWIASSRPGARGAEIRFRELATLSAGTIAVEEERPRRLIAGHGNVFWLGGPEHDRLREARRSAEGAWGVRNVTNLAFTADLLAADDTSVYAVTTDGMLVRSDRERGQTVVLATGLGAHVVDLAVQGRWIYWLDSGPDVQRCRTERGAAPSCERGYHIGPDVAHPSGSLRRVLRAGGAAEVVARDLPDVGKLAFVGGVGWITTRRGPLRVDPLGGRPTFQPGTTTEARYVALGDGLVTLVAPPGRDPEVPPQAGRQPEGPIAEVRMLAMP